MEDKKQNTGKTRNDCAKDREEKADARGRGQRCRRQRRQEANQGTNGEPRKNTTLGQIPLTIVSVTILLAFPAFLESVLTLPTDLQVSSVGKTLQAQVQRGLNSYMPLNILMSTLFPSFSNIWPYPACLPIVGVTRWEPEAWSQQGDKILGRMAQNSALRSVQSCSSRENHLGAGDQVWGWGQLCSRWQTGANRFILGKFGVSIPINSKSSRMAGWAGQRGHLYHGREHFNCLTGDRNSCTDLSTTVDSDKVRWRWKYQGHPVSRRLKM